VEEIVMLFTPASRRAVKRHTDEVDVITLQIYGTKHWDIWTDVELKDCGKAMPRFAIDLQPGSLLYVPANAPHSVVSGSDESLSVALPLYRRSHRELLQELFKLPSIARVLEKPVPGKDDVGMVREQLGKMTSALAAVSDGTLSSAMTAVRRRP
jgi:ribosomal protein L16 Arg81 hydroxylase